MSDKRKYHQYSLMQRGLIAALFFLFLIRGFSQDPHFSQFYANPLYLNPALAGTAECSRIMFNYRNQWPSLSSGFKTYAFSADSYISALSGGIGVAVFSDDAAGMINTLRLGGIYAFHLKLNEFSTLNMGLEGAYFQRKLNWDDLVFSDMINYADGTVLQGISAEQVPDRLTVSAADFSLGFLYAYHEKFYLGLAGHHLTEPAIGYYNSTDESLYRKYTAHAGAIFTLIDGDYKTGRGKLILNPNVLYQQQQNAQQLNLGVNMELMPLVAGVWYRYNFKNPDGIIFLLGLKQKRFKFGYSYDLTMSELAGESGGAHELSLTLFLNCDKRNKPGAIKCPEF
ncbi:MAG: PorP/SprF family type IX secretion system membrane protein [Bacteroidales bacterium]|nr:PorP/SprF family type IX secretion system membrane protein [Bacteroidales bacterium]